jgi:hypothetical protein
MKKETAAWNIAATHFLTAGFVIPLLVSIVAGMIFTAVGMEDGVISTVIANNVVMLIATWLGVMYSAGYLAKKYHIESSSKIVNLSTSYKLILSLIFIVLAFSASSGNLESVAYVSVPSILGLIVFYVASKKYVKQDSVSTETN